MAAVAVGACSKKDSLYIDSSKDGAPPAEPAAQKAAEPATQPAEPAKETPLPAAKS